MEILLLISLLVFGILAVENIFFRQKTRSLDRERDRLVMERIDMIHNEIIILSMAVWPDRKEEFEKMIIETPKGR